VGPAHLKVKVMIAGRLS